MSAVLTVPVKSFEVSDTTSEACGADHSTPAAGDIRNVACVSASGQARALRDRIDGGALASMSEAEVVELISEMTPAALVAYIRIAIGPANAHEYQMRRRERVNGYWPSKADHIEVRCQDSPRRIYAKWLADGAHAGQEIIYDETHDEKRFMGHFGGPWRFLSGSFAVDGTFTQIRSRHSIRDLGIGFVLRTLEHDMTSFAAEGVSAKPTHIDVPTVGGRKVLALTWDSQYGPPAHFAPRVSLMLDLHRAQLRGVTATDLDGTLIEDISFEHISPRTWTDDAFNPHNPAYEFPH